MKEYIDLLKYYSSISSSHPKFPLHLIAGTDVGAITVETSSQDNSRLWVYYEEEKLYIQGQENHLKRLYVKKLYLPRYKATLLNETIELDDKEEEEVALGGWVLDEEMPFCMICHQTFRSLFIGRHHCRACGNLICAACSPGMEMIYKFEELGPQRVCIQCHWGQSPVYPVTRQYSFSSQQQQQQQILSVSNMISNKNSARLMNGIDRITNATTNIPFSDNIMTTHTIDSINDPSDSFDINVSINQTDVSQTQTIGSGMTTIQGDSWKHRRLSTRLIQSMNSESKIELAEINNRREDVDMAGNEGSYFDPAIEDSLNRNSGAEGIALIPSIDLDSPVPSRRSLEDMNGLSPRHSETAEWKKFLAAGEILIATSTVLKRSPYGIMQSRQLLLTDAPALIYADPKTKEFKGEIPWDERNPPVVKMIDGLNFEVSVPGRIYRFTDNNNGAKYWSDHINRTAKEFLII